MLPFYIISFSPGLYENAPCASSPLNVEIKVPQIVRVNHYPSMNMNSSVSSELNALLMLSTPSTSRQYYKPEADVDTTGTSTETQQANITQDTSLNADADLLLSASASSSSPLRAGRIFSSPFGKLYNNSKFNRGTVAPDIFTRPFATTTENAPSPKVKQSPAGYFAHPLPTIAASPAMPRNDHKNPHPSHFLQQHFAMSTMPKSDNANGIFAVPHAKLPFPVSPILANNRSDARTMPHNVIGHVKEVSMNLFPPNDVHSHYVNPFVSSPFALPNRKQANSPIAN